MIKRVFSVLAALLFLLTAASCGTGLGGFGKEKKEEPGISLPGTYEDGSGMTWILARDRTLRITDQDRNCVLGTWEEAEDRNDRLVISFPSLSGDGEGAEARELKYSGDEERLELRIPGSKEYIASLQKVGKAPRTAGLKENTETVISGSYARGERAYHFSGDGTAEILDPNTFPDAGKVLTPYRYAIEGNRLTLSAPGADQDGERTLWFELEEDGMTLFPDGLESTGIFLPLEDIPAAAGTPAPTEAPEPTEEPQPTEAPEPTEEPGPTEAPEPTEEPGPTEAPEPTETPEPTVDPADIEEPKPTEEPEPVPEDTELFARYYSLTVPGELEGLYTADCSEDTVQLYENRSRDDGWGGYLFGVTLLAEEDFSFLQWPSFDYLGMLDAPDGTAYHIIAAQPTDVQCSPDGRDSYARCAEYQDTILSSLKGVRGARIVLPEDMAPQNRQIVYVEVWEYNGVYSASLQLLEWDENRWEDRLLWISAAVGSNGITPDKREGDHCTPSGTFNILFCFSDRTLDTGLRQKVLSDGDVWVTDRSSRYYNTIQSNSAGFKDWSKSENIYRQMVTGRSVAGIFFDYNGDGESSGTAVSGAGAALFLDGVGSSGDINSGYGDIKIQGSDMLQLLRLLDKSMDPVIIIRAGG